MSLELHIYGSGYGETILLRWPTATGWNGAVVDARCLRKGEWLAGKIRELEIDNLELVSATHPHADHIYNLAAGVEASGKPVGKCTFWGGGSLSLWRAFFIRLEKENKEVENQRFAQMAHEFIKWLLRKHATPVRDLVGDPDDSIHTFFETVAGTTALKFRSLGPWFDGMAQIARDLTAVKDGKPLAFKLTDANAVSTAMLIEYGDAQIVLGADMEEANWAEVAKSTGYPQFRPSVVKVSHHGSANGRIQGMWPQGGGFFHGRGKDAIAVVTPWQLAGNELPKGTAIIEEICAAGFDLYLTAQGSGRNAESHVAIRVEADGSADVISIAKDVRHFPRHP